MPSNRLGTMPETPFDWPGLMRLGFGQLGLPPDVFWQMTPWELRLALEGAGLMRADGHAMNRRALAALMQAHPDGPANPED